MNDTPRTDEASYKGFPDCRSVVDFARQLEQELEAMTKERDELELEVAQRKSEVREMMEVVDRSQKQRDEAISAIKDFVRESQWCADIWKKQDHIKRLFDIAKTRDVGNEQKA